MRYRKSVELKEAGLKWVDSIPNEWDEVKLKFLSNVNPKKSQVKLDSDAEVTYLPMESLEEFGGMDTSQTKNLKEVYDGYTYFQEGDVLSAKITPCFENGKAAIAENLINEVGFGTTEIHVLRPRENILKEILFYNLISHHYLKLGEASMYGAGGQKRVSTEFLEEFRIPLPPKPEQRSIAAFLDRKTEAIDRLIQKKEQLIDRLKEKRQALISQAVTKGIDLDVPMKDSGIEWLGEIPEEWHVVKFNRIGKQVSGGTPKKNELDYWNGDIPWVSPKDFKEEFLSKSEDYITQAGLKNSSSKLIPEDSLLMVVRSGVLRHTLPVAVNTVEMAINQDIKAIIFRSFANSNYFKYLIKAHNNVLLTLLRKEGTTVESIESDYLNNLWVPLPPKETQTEIANFVSRQVNTYQEILDGIEHTMEKLKEYRQSLISGAVTGKVDVRSAYTEEAASADKDEAEVEVDKEVKGTQSANIYFKRRVLAAKILDDLHQELTLGRRKLQKILYLLEKEIEAVELKGKYQKDAAGPFDNKMMRSIESQLKKAEWFKQVERENGYGYKYIPMIKKDEYKKYYNRYWGNINNEIEELIELVRPEKTGLLSLVATLYACWNDFLIKEEEFDGKKLIYESRHNWHEEKKEIPYSDWAEALKWMDRNSLEPQGVGELTKEKN